MPIVPDDPKKTTMAFNFFIYIKSLIILLNGIIPWSYILKSSDNINL